VEVEAADLAEGLGGHSFMVDLMGWLLKVLVIFGLVVDEVLLIDLID
jgi:hypothetical protein